jgi:hypothetical protein
MTDLETIEKLIAESKRLSINPNALAASGLRVSIDRAPYRCTFGDNPFPKVAERWSAAIFRVMVENSESSDRSESATAPLCP